MRRLTITLDDYLYESLFDDLNGNKSSFVRKLLVAGSDAICEKGTTKFKAMKIISENERLNVRIRELETQVKNFQGELGRIKKPKYSARVIEAMKEIDSIRDADLHTRL